MKRILSAAFAAAMVLSCAQAPEKTASVNLIFETDMGNDIDDAIALDMIYKYVDAGDVNLLAVNLNKGGQSPAEYVDIMNTWYGYPDVPVGICHHAMQNENHGYTAHVAGMKDAEGKPLFARTVADVDALPDAVALYRKILASQPDNSVTIASVGFSTNLVLLLDSPADSWSSLTGKELIAKKVKLLSVMAGGFTEEHRPEYNVLIDVPSAKKVFGEWPGEIVFSPWEVGDVIRYPATSIENDFTWAKPAHPLAEAYKAYLEMPYDRQTWDPTAVLYAVEGGDWFTVSEPGCVTVDDEGATFFSPSENGNRRILSVTETQASSILEHFISIVTAKPAIWQ